MGDFHGERCKNDLLLSWYSSELWYTHPQIPKIYSVTCKVYIGYHGTRQGMVCPPVRSIIHSLKLVNYLSVHAHKPCSISYSMRQGKHRDWWTLSTQHHASRHTTLGECWFNIGIKHGFACINICKVPRELLKTGTKGIFSNGFDSLWKEFALVGANSFLLQ